MTFKVFFQPNCHKCPAVKNYLLTLGMEGESINALEHMEDCSNLGISSTPTVLFYDDSNSEIGRAYDIEGIKKICQKD